MDKDNIKWIILGAIVLIVFSMKGALPKEAVANIQGAPCETNADCPCWGEYNMSKFDYTISPAENATAIGIGVSQCKGATETNLGTCDTTWCFDVEPVGNWANEHPWTWLKNNPMITVAIVGLALMLIFWPKR